MRQEQSRREAMQKAGAGFFGLLVTGSSVVAGYRTESDDSYNEPADTASNTSLEAYLQDQIRQHGKPEINPNADVSPMTSDTPIETNDTRICSLGSVSPDCGGGGGGGDDDNDDRSDNPGSRDDICAWSSDETCYDDDDVSDDSSDDDGGSSDDSSDDDGGSSDDSSDGSGDDDDQSELDLSITTWLDRAASRHPVGAKVIFEVTGDRHEIEEYEWDVTDHGQITDDRRAQIWAVFSAEEEVEKTVEVTVEDLDGNEWTAEQSIIIDPEMEYRVGGLEYDDGTESVWRVQSADTVQGRDGEMNVLEAMEDNEFVIASDESVEFTAVELDSTDSQLEGYHKETRILEPSEEFDSSRYDLRERSPSNFDPRVTLDYGEDKEFTDVLSSANITTHVDTSSFGDLAQSTNAYADVRRGEDSLHVVSHGSGGITAEASAEVMTEIKMSDNATPPDSGDDEGDDGGSDYEPPDHGIVRPPTDPIIALESDSTAVETQEEESDYYLHVGIDLDYRAHARNAFGGAELEITAYAYDVDTETTVAESQLLRGIDDRDFTGETRVGQASNIDIHEGESDEKSPEQPLVIQNVTAGDRYRIGIIAQTYTATGDTDSLIEVLGLEASISSLGAARLEEPTQNASLSEDALNNLHEFYDTGLHHDDNGITINSIELDWKQDI